METDATVATILRSLAGEGAGGSLVDSAADQQVGGSRADDYALMDAIAAGDANALRDFYDRHSGLVFATCLRMLRDRNESEDLLVDIFHEVWQKASRFDANRGSPLTYLMTLTRSRAIDRQRRRLKIRASDIDQTDVEAAGLQPDVPLIADETRVAVVQALQSLEPAQRQAIECAYYDGLSHSEIAAKLNKPLGTIKTYIRQGLIHLRDGLRNTYGGTAAAKGVGASAAGDRRSS